MKRLLISLILFISVLSCFAQQTIELNHWKFKTGDNAEWAAPDFNDSDWKAIAICNWEEAGYDGYDGYAWYRIKFNLPSSLMKKAIFKDSIRILLGKIDDCDQTFINGQVLGQNNRSIPAGSSALQNISKLSTAWNVTRSYTLATNDPRLLWDKENVIAIRVFDGSGGGGMYSVPANISMKDLSDYLIMDIESNPLEVKPDGTITKTISLKNLSPSALIKGKLNIEINGNGSLIASQTYNVDLPKDERTFTINFKGNVLQTMKAVYTFTDPKTSTLISRSGKLQPPFTSNYINNQASLFPRKYIELPLGAIKPQGWLLEQLNIMKNGSTGHLDEYYWKLKDDNGWLGGKGDGWEEGPYWLDGAVPLAYLLDDKTLQEKVLKYINWTLDNQRPSGYFGPITKYERETGKKVEKGEQGDDWWPKMVMLKVMQQYYSATGDQRVISFMTRYFQYQFRNLSEFPFSCKQEWEWAKSRGEDNLLVVYWLYNITKDKFLLDLGDIIYKQTFSWTNWLSNREWVMDAAAQQGSDNWMHRHGVNVGMGIKTPVIYYQSQGDQKYLDAFKTGFTDLMRLHGLPMGIFSADEDLHGNAPTQGSELCAIVETMFSLEQAMSITGDNTYMDALERMTFNALPTQTTDDYNNKQYYQMANQVQVSKGVYDFSLPCGDKLTNVFGPRSGYTCCLANMHQGWTKFVSRLWYATPDNGLAALVYAPGMVTAKVWNGVPVTINEETNYPFGNTVTFKISLAQNTTFPLEFRIPKWCNEAIVSLNGIKLCTEKGNQMARLEREWKNGDKLTLEFPMQVTVSKWGRNSRTIERGPLVYALKIGERWEKKMDTVTTSGEFFEVYPTTPWNYGIIKTVFDDPVKNTKVIEKPSKGNFFWNPANAPIEIQVSARRIPAWTLVNGVAYQPVTERNGTYEGDVSSTVETITLIPYGCSKLRIVAFPTVK